MGSTRGTSTSSRSTGRSWVVPVAVVAACVALLAIVLFEPGGTTPAGTTVDDTADSPTAGPPPEAEPPALELERRDPDDVLASGPVDAPVTLVVFSDYQCPFCAAWSQQTLPTMREYVATGDLRIEWRDVNIMSDVSEPAAIAAYAAALQDRFWGYHELLFPDGDVRPASELTEDGLVELAEGLGLNLGRFRDDMAAADTLAAIDRNAQEGLSAGVFSTPAFVLDGTPILGAQPTDVFVDAVEHALQTGG